MLSEGPCIYIVYILGRESSYMGTALGPKYMLYTCMDPLGYFAPDFGFMASVCSVFPSPEIWSMALLYLQ